MNPQDANRQGDELFFKLHKLVTATLEDPACPEATELNELLRVGGPAIRREYAAYIDETEALRSARTAGVAPLDEAIGPRLAPVWRTAPRRTSSRWGLLAATACTLAACLLLAVGAASWWNPNEQVAVEGGLDSGTASSEGVGTVIRLIAVQWEDDAEMLEEMARIRPGQRIQIKSGQIELMFDTGVELVVAGRADAEVKSPMSVVGRLGAYSARVGERGKGFTIDTPTTRVVDLGTEFGVVIADSGDTEVAVFKGMVDLDSPVAGPGSPSSDRLTQGEAVKIDKLGNHTRVMSITSERFPTPGRRLGFGSAKPPLLFGVRDNLRDPANKKFYRLVRSGLFEDVPAFVDRFYEWNGVDEGGLPEFLVGAEYLMPFNDDKVKTDFKLTVSLSAPARLFVLYSNKMPVPSWLSDRFEDTGEDVGLDRQGRSADSKKRLAVGPGQSIDETFSVWRCDFASPCDVALGYAAQPLDGEDGWNMYGIAATPLIPLTAAR